MISSHSPAAIAEELGNRLKQARLNANLTQAEVAARTGVSRKIIMSAEKGFVQLESLVAIMIALDLVRQLDNFLPKQEISPIQLAKIQGKQRQRASGSKLIKSEAPSEW
jgi:transcriptional regulator with XRE-family HTH domain